MSKKRGAVVATLILFAALASLVINDSDRVGGTAEVWVPCDVIQDNGTAALKAEACVDGLVVTLLVTIKASEAALTGDEMVQGALDQTGLSMQEARDLLPGLEVIGHYVKDVCSGAGCPSTRLKLFKVTSGCIGGSTRTDPSNPWRFGQACGATAECEPGKTCPDVGLSEHAGSGQFVAQVCASASADYPGVCG